MTLSHRLSSERGKIANLAGKIKEKNAAKIMGIGRALKAHAHAREASYSQAVAGTEAAFGPTAIFASLRDGALHTPEKMTNVLLDDGLTDGLRMNHCNDPADFDPEPTTLPAKWPG